MDLKQKKYKYNHFRYDAALLPLERMQAIVNGQTVDSAFHLFREPPLITFAKERKQVTTIERKVLQTPISKTNQNLLIEDYLLERSTFQEKRHRFYKDYK